MDGRKANATRGQLGMAGARKSPRRKRQGERPALLRKGKTRLDLFRNEGYREGGDDTLETADGVKICCCWKPELRAALCCF